MRKFYLFTLSALLFATGSFAQVTVTNPTNTTPNLSATYTSLANAIAALDAITVISGPVTIILNPGNPETAPAGGYVIQFTATTSAINTVTIAGGNNIITAFTPQAPGALNDGIFKIIGADYITIQNFTMRENPANTSYAGANNLTEFGVALLRASTTDGPQNNTIQNNIISLDRAYSNTFGVYSNSRASATAVATTADITSITGSSFGNKIYGNTISNVNYGVVFNGSGVATQMDDNNDIGGSSPATGNTFTNWGSLGTAVSAYPNLTSSNYCIFVNQQTNDNISYNTITGATHITTNVHGGILKNYSLGQPTGTITSTISNNTITVTSSNSTAGMTVIQNAGMTTLATASVYIQNNTIVNCAITGAATTAAFIGITNSSVPGVLNMNNNIIRGITSTATTGGFIGLINTGAATTTINMNNNQIGSTASNAITYSNALNALIRAIDSQSGTATTTVNMNNNVILGLSGVSNASNTYGITNSATNPVTINMTGNTLGNSTRDFITYTSASTGQVYGIINGAGSSTTNLNITNNTVDRIIGVSFSSTLAGISNLSSAIGGIMNFNNNAIGTSTGVFLATTAASSGTFYGIWNSNGATTATLNMNSNTVDGFFLHSTTVNLTTMACNGSSIGTASMNNNIFGSTGTLINFSGVQGSLGTFRVMDIGAGNSNAAAVVACQNNTIKGINYAVTGAGTVTGIYLNSTPLSVTISGNQFQNLNLNTTGDVWMILDFATRASGESCTINNNSIVTALTKTSGSGSVSGSYSTGSSVNGSILNITNNSFNNINATGTSNIYGVVAVDGVSTTSGPTVAITGNMVNNIIGGSGDSYGVYTDYAAGATCSSNNISNFTGTGNMYGFYYGSNNGQGVFTCASNTISSLVSSGTGGNVRGIFSNGGTFPVLNANGNTITGLSTTGNSATVNGILLNTNPTIYVYDNLINNLSGSGTASPAANGINIVSGTTLNVYGNKIYNISESGIISSTSPAVTGMTLSGGTAITVYNNFVADLKATNANLADAVRGIALTSNTAGSTYNLYYNSVYLNAVSTGTNFGTAALYHSGNASPTTGTLNAIDNIFVNTSAPNGTGFTVAHRNANLNLNNYGSSSDYNLFYAGTPSSTRLIYYDGTNSDQTLAAYKTRVSTRDANSISLMPVFTSATDLHLTSANCQIDGRGTPVAGITADIDGTTRDIDTPDIGADEFVASLNTTLAGVAGGAICENKTVSVTGTTFVSNTCDLIAKLLPSGGDAVAGKINTCVTLDATQQYFNAEPYVQRHFDIEPISANTTTTSATITLYFNDIDFVNFNTNTVAWPKLPTVAGGGNADPNKANLKVTQYHGTATTSPSTPGNYTANAGSGFYINPADANIVWNGSYWAVTFDVAGFSGFYVHTNPQYPLPVSFNYLNGIKQGNDHLLTWSVTCNSTPRVTLTLERSADQRNFNSIYSITADAVRCSQPFNYTDAQPLTGMNYYRLKIVDVDGKITYSNIIALINGTKGFALMNIAPNPVKGNSFNLNATSAAATKMEIVISDMQGRVVNRQTISLAAGFNSKNINVSTLSPGTYNIYGITSDDKSGLIRFVKQ